jgi:hypothetical protein
MREAMTALGAFGGVVLGVLVAMGPGGLDSRLYWRAPTPSVHGAQPDSEGAATDALEAEEAAVGAVRGGAEGSGDEGVTDTSIFFDDEPTYTEAASNADSVSPEPTPTPATDATERPPGETFPPLSQELQDRFRNAWFNGANEAEMIRRGTPPAKTGASPADAGVAEAGPTENVAEPTEPEGTVSASGGEVVNNVVVEEVVEEGAPTPETLPEGVARGTLPTEGGPTDAPLVPPPVVADEYGYANQAAMDELVVVPRGALLPREYLGTDPRYDPFVGDARLNEARQSGATTGGAWTGGAWTGGATTGGAWTGGAWTGGATTGGAWTGGAWGSW